MAGVAGAVEPGLSWFGLGLGVVICAGLLLAFGMAVLLLGMGMNSSSSCYDS